MVRQPREFERIDPETRITAAPIRQVAFVWPSPTVRKLYEMATFAESEEGVGKTSVSELSAAIVEALDLTPARIAALLRQHRQVLVGEVESNTPVPGSLILIAEHAQRPI